MLFDRGLLLTTLRLCHSFRLQPKYNGFREKLGKLLPLPNWQALPPTSNENIDAVLEVLQMERKRVEVMEAGEEGYNWPQASVDNVDDALKILVCNATEEFGFVPRDVYEGVLDLPTTRSTHAAAVKKLNYTKLNILAEIFSNNPQLEIFSHRVVAIHPVQCAGRHDGWTITFKSKRIAREVVELMRLEEDKYLRKTYDLFRKIPESSTLAGWVFEAIVHRMLSDGRELEGPTLRPIRMDRDESDPPTFSIEPSSSPPSTPDASLSSLPPPRARTKAVTLVNFTHKLSDVALDNVTLDNNRYYVPTATNNSLFDSFTIDRDLDRDTTVISVFHITTSSTYGGSTEGYPLIRKTVTRVRDLLESEGLGAAVEVAYFLVCPDDGSKRQWQMPIGWNDGVKFYDHRGGAFCIRVPAPVQRSAPGKEAKAWAKKRTTKKGKVRYCHFKSTTVKVSHTNATATHD